MHDNVGIRVGRRGVRYIDPTLLLHFSTSFAARKTEKRSPTMNPDPSSLMNPNPERSKRHCLGGLLHLVASVFTVSASAAAPARNAGLAASSMNSP
jgi:hypothetical protein